MAPRLEPVSTGISGLDDVLLGGFPRSHFYLVEGDPGAGKTTLGLQFLIEGRKRGEKGLYVTLSETKTELWGVAASHGWSLEEIDIYELGDIEERLKPESQYTVFHPAEIELTETTKRILDEVDRLQPARVVFDSLSELRLLAREELRYRRQILGLKQFFSARDCTVLLLDDRSTPYGEDSQLQSISHGVLLLERVSIEYGTPRRRLSVTKMRGAQFREGFHDFSIRRGGLSVYPRLVAAEHATPVSHEQVASGSAELDTLLGGGVARSSSVLLMGPAGSGKSTLATQYILAEAQRGGRAAFYIYEEARATFLARSAGMGMNLEPYVQNGAIHLQQVDPAEMSPGQFAHYVRRAVDSGVRMIVIDSLNGYLNAMPSERHLLVHMHELLTYLGQQGVLTFLTVAQHGLVGGTLQVPVEVSYLADTVIMLRFFEAAGEVRQAISVVKKRHGQHERTIRELAFSSHGIGIGEPLREFRGVLTGVPVYEGPSNPLLHNVSL
ncbi:MAG: AAA family ATPase [Acidobacteriia bacterium]|nr:AAA family ATPase [Terriglobia bacterium]